MLLRGRQVGERGCICAAPYAVVPFSVNGRGGEEVYLLFSTLCTEAVLCEDAW